MMFQQSDNVLYKQSRNVLIEWYIIPSRTQEGGMDIGGWHNRDDIKGVKEAGSDTQSNRRGAEPGGSCLHIRDNPRQIRRIKSAVIREGDIGIIHKTRGRPSKRKISEDIREAVIKLYSGKYKGFGPTLFKEKIEIEDVEGIEISKETIRKWLIIEGLWEKRRWFRYGSNYKDSAKY